MTLIRAPVIFWNSGPCRCSGSAICGPVKVTMFTVTPANERGAAPGAGDGGTTAAARTRDASTARTRTAVTRDHRIVAPPEERVERRSLDTTMRAEARPPPARGRRAGYATMTSWRTAAREEGWGRASSARAPDEPPRSADDGHAQRVRAPRPLLRGRGGGRRRLPLRAAGRDPHLAGLGHRGGPALQRRAGRRRDHRVPGGPAEQRPARRRARDPDAVCAQRSHPPGRVRGPDVGPAPRGQRSGGARGVRQAGRGAHGAGALPAARGGPRDDPQGA